MKTAHGLVALAAVACAVLAVIASLDGSGAAATEGASPEGKANAAEAARGVGPAGAAPDAAQSAAPGRDPAAPAGRAQDAAARAGGAAAGMPWAVAGVSWPVSRTARGERASASTAEPAVPVRIAFRALWYLGVDPEAEKTWSRAINDPNMPEGVRSDLIVDMIDEGYTDNSHPTKADLPVILARLEIIERHAPYAMDPVNRAAFEEVYRNLLELYIRLGGAPRNRR